MFESDVGRYDFIRVVLTFLPIDIEASGLEKRMIGGYREPVVASAIEDCINPSAGVEAEEIFV